MKITNKITNFSLLAGINRVIIPTQVSALAKSIENMGVLRPIVTAVITFITGKPVRYIIDGQHLYFALTQLKMPYPSIEIKIKTPEELIHKIALLNSSSKSWKIVDYILAWSFTSKHYVKLNHYFNTYDIDISILAAVLSGKTGDSASTIPHIKKGTFKIVNETANVKILDYITDMLKIVPRMTRYENKYVIREYIKFIKKTPKYNHSSYLVKLEKNKKQFILATQEEGLLQDLFRSLL